MKDIKEYINQLKVLEFQEEKKDSSSIYIVDRQAEYLSQEVPPYIIVALDKAKELKADAVYFRFFDDGRPPLAQIYIYDDIWRERTKEEYNTIHREVWSSCEVPVYMIVDKLQIKVFDGRDPIEIDGDKIDVHPIATINGQNEVFKKYRAQLFNNGAFWETDIAKSHFLYKTGAAENLLNALRVVRKKFKQLTGATPELSDRLLIVCILIKYLEENGIDPETNKNLAHEFFMTNTGYNSLTEILYHNKLSALLRALSVHFNGGIFLMKDKSNPDKDMYAEIANLNLSSLAKFFDAGSSENLFGWQKYSFEHIPVELISNLYEEFLPREKKNKKKKTDTPENGSVYTPSFLVNLLVDECLPLTFEDTNENIKLIDPACGSGIFLVTAYKRLVQRWRLRHRNNGELANPEPETLKKLLKDNIFGIDIHYNSVHLTEFSLQLALCSMLKPRQIWTTKDLFNDLKKDGNIIEKDFFDYLGEEVFTRDFDLVIGNPPFKELSKKQFVIYKEQLTKFEKQDNIILQVPFYQESLLFLSTSFLLLKKGTGKLCLIMKSGPFLYSGDKDKSENVNLKFRTTLFNQYNITQIIDFTLLKKLFRANVETAAVIINNKPAENDAITHIVVRETRSAVEKSYFELSHYDFHEVPTSDAASTPYVWRCNVLGGVQVYHLVNRLKKYQKLKDYLETKKTEGWDYGQGYKLGNKSKTDVEKVINGKNTVIDKFFTENGIGKIEIQTETSFEYIPAKSKSIFSPPHLLMKKTMGKNHTPIEIRDDYLTFRNETLGIHSPSNCRNELLNLEIQLKNSNDIFRFLIAATSARSGTKRSMGSSDLSDLLNLPLLVEESFNPSISEKIIIEDVLNYYIEDFKIGHKAKMQETVKDTEKVIKAFSKVYCDSLNKIYTDKENKGYYLSKITEGDSFFVCEYTFGDRNNYVYEQSGEKLDDLLISWNPSHSVRYSRIIRIYEHDVIRLVKPKKLMFWLQSTALRDVSDTLEDALNK